MCYFLFKQTASAENQRLLICLAVACFSVFASITSGNAQTEKPPSDSSSNKLLPPALSERSLPAPQVVSTPPVPAHPKAAFAWKHKAVNLSMERFQPPDQARPPGPLTRSFEAPYSETFEALVLACKESGMKIESINSAAGQVLAQNKDSSGRIVFSLWEQPEGKTWITAGVDRGRIAGGTRSAQTILDAVNSTISRRGRI